MMRFPCKRLYLVLRGEIVEDVEPPLPLTTPLLLVKPPVGLATPAVFKALDLERRSTTDPLELLRGLGARGAIEPELCVNDLEQPAFDVLPSLARLKQRLTDDSAGRFSAVFMTGRNCPEGTSAKCLCVLYGSLPAISAPNSFLLSCGDGGVFLAVFMIYCNIKERVH